MYRARHSIFGKNKRGAQQLTAAPHPRVGRRRHLRTWKSFRPGQLLASLWLFAADETLSRNSLDWIGRRR